MRGKARWARLTEIANREAGKRKRKPQGSENEAGEFRNRIPGSGMGRWIRDQNGHISFPHFSLNSNYFHSMCEHMKSLLCFTRNGTRFGMHGYPPCRCHLWTKTSPIPALPGIPRPHFEPGKLTSSGSNPRISTRWEQAGNLSLDKAPDPEKHRPLTTHLSLFDLQNSGIFHPSSHLPLRGQGSSCSIFCSMVSLNALAAPFGGFVTHGAAGTFPAFPDTGNEAGLPHLPRGCHKGSQRDPRVPSTAQSELSSSFLVPRAIDELSLH